MSAEIADAAQGLPTIVINNTHQLAPWADILYAADEEWWQHHPEAMAFPGSKVTVGNVRGVHRLEITGGLGFDADPRRVRTGSNSGYQALHIAVHTGAKRILLLGYDMQGGHWHPEHNFPLKTTTDSCYEKWIRRFGELAPILKGMGVEVLNCTPGSALTCFPHHEPFSTLLEERQRVYRPVVD
jgi:hypothetical protein